MTADPPTIGSTLATGKGLADFLDWADTHDCAAPATRLANVLLAHKASRWLGDALDLVASQHPLLASWAEAGAELFNLDQLALALAGNERSAFPWPRRVKATAAVRDLPGLSATHYLQLALICSSLRRATPPETTSFNVLRTWLLVEALQRAEDGNISDEFLKTAADGLRQAGEEPGEGSWTPVVRRIAPPADNLNTTRLHLISVSVRLLAEADTYRPGTAVERFLRAVGELARGNSRPIPTDPQLSTGLLPVPAPSSRPALPSFFEEPIDDAPPPLVRPVSEDFQDPEADGSAGVGVAEVDPDKTTAELTDAARYIHLTSAAQARLPLWNWDVVNPTESTALAERLEAAYRSDDLSIRATAAITELAVAAGRSLTGATQLPVGDRPHPSGDWTVDLARGCILRTAPRRSFHERRMPAMAEHLRPVAVHVGVRLAERCVLTLRSLMHRPTQAGTPKRVIDLWPDRVRSPARAFLDWLRDDPVLWRLKPGTLGSLAPRTIYAATGDWLLARLLTSQATAAASESGLPGAAAYSAYSGEEVTAALAQWFSSAASDNSAGSLIDTADAFYRNGLSRMCDAVDRAAEAANVLDHHNLVSLYWDTLLRAGSGARPSTGLWTWAHVDFVDAFAYIDDKTGIDESAARWVPLPTDLVQLLRQEYRGRHVPRVTARLQEEFGSQADPVCSALENGLVWIRHVGGDLIAEPIGPEHRALHAGIAAESPLVMNAFRHRARTVWRRLGCPQEIIDSFLAHSDGASRSHGDISPRVWRADAAIARPAIEAAFNSLGARAPVPWRGAPANHVAPAAVVTAGQVTPLALDRTGTRWRTLLRAARQTVAELAIHACRHQPDLIAKLPEGRDRPRLPALVSALGQWSEPQVEDLVKDLSRTASGTPSTLGKLRLLFLGHLADRCWNRTGLKPQLRRRSFANLVNDPPRASPTGIGATGRMAVWSQQLRAITAGLRGSSLRTADAAALLLVDLTLVSRITDAALLHDAVVGRVRVVVLDRVPHIEWAPGGELPELGHGVVRHRISPEAASYAAELQSAEKLPHSILSNASAKLKPLLNAMGLASPVSLLRLCDRLRETVDAVNCLELPGNVAAARGGRLRTASLSWPDWSRDQAGGYFCPARQPSTEETSSDGDESGPPATSRFEASAVDAMAAARLFCKDIRRVLESLRQGGVDRKPTTAQRREMARAVGRECTKYTGRVAPALLSLGRWCESLFDRTLTGNQLLKISSIRRYFAALSPRFERLAYDLNLYDLDDEDITDLYLSILQMRGTARPSYVLNRLREFHRASSSPHALPQPDWSELSVQDIGIGVSPGYLDEQAYLRVLTKLIEDGSPLRRSAAAMALLGYRFGLRKAEAALLRVKDVVEYAGARHIIVASMRRRDTKSRRGRRVVPLLFELTSIESTLLDELLFQGRERVKTNPEALLLGAAGEVNEQVDADAVAREVGTALKAMTGNLQLTEHHLRHSFTCVVWKALELPYEVMADEPTREKARRIRATLLAEDTVGRRAPWALASVLGHAHPSRSYISYVHFLCERADDLIFGATHSGAAIPSWPALVDLGLHPRSPPTASLGKPKASVEPPGIVKVMLCIRMLANDGEPSAVARSLKVDPKWLMSVVAAIEAIDTRLGLTSKDEEKDGTGRYEKLSASGLLGHIHRSAATRLEALLNAAEAVWLEGAAHGLNLPLDEFCGMVGYRRQFSLWKEAQMDFMRVLVLSTGIDSGRLKLIRPVSLADTVRALARRTGWIALDPSDEAIANVKPGLHRIDLRETTGPRQEPTKFGDPEVVVLHRYSLALDPAEGTGVGNRLELVFASLCFWAWLNAQTVQRGPSEQHHPATA